jgi:class 3 adenylate cyclase
MVRLKNYRGIIEKNPHRRVVKNMNELLKFRSIWTKVFGLTATLVTIMLIAASVSFAISYYKVNDVRLRVSHLAHVVVPLNRVAANIDAFSLQEEIRLERVLRKWATDPQNEESYQEDIEQFLEFESIVEAEIATANEILNETLEQPQWLSSADAIEFGRITLLMENIEKEHRDFFLHAKGILESLTNEGSQDTQQKIVGLEAQADHLDKELLTLLGSLEQLNATQAQEIESAEVMIMRIYGQNFILTFVVFLIGIVVSSLVTTRLVNPVRDLKLKSDEISKGNLDVQAIPYSKDEVGQLALSFNHMVEQLRANNRIKELFGKYVDPRIVDSLLLESPESLGVDGSKQEMSIFFSDVKGFSGISELLTAAGLVRLINRYFSIMTEPIFTEKGVIDKYVGDCIMAFWGPPFTQEEQHAVLACRAALAQFDQLKKLNAALPEILGFRNGIPDLQIRIGLATGEVLSGNIGSDNAKSYTVMGDTVNIASRLESLNKKYGTHILIDELTRIRIGDQFVVREIDRVTVAGKADVTQIYELFAIAGKAQPPLQELFLSYESGLKAYREMNWDLAEEKLSVCLRLNPDDGPALLLIERIGQFRNDPPAEDWGGIWRFTDK